MSWWIKAKEGQELPHEVYLPQRETPTPRVGDHLRVDDVTWLVERVERILRAERRHEGHYLDIVFIEVCDE